MTDIAVYSVDADNIVRFSLANITRQIDGPEEALQLVAFAFFTNPGSCLFARQDGGGAKKKFVGPNIPGPQQLRADAAVVVRDTFETVRRAQRPGRPANATVVGLDLIDAYSNDQSIFIKVRIRLLSGNSFNITLPGTPS